MSFKLVSAIVRSPWLIRPDWAKSHFPLVVQLLNGDVADLNWGIKKAYEDDGDYEPAKNCVVLVVSGNTVQASRYRSFNDAPEGSIAMIPVTGPILKYGGECGEPGAIHIAGWLNDAKASPKIAGAIIKIDSPGGQVDGTQTVADSIKNFGKPVIGFIDDGMMASAAMWIGSACDEIYASQLTDEAGSIGVLSSFADFRGWYEQKGIKLHEVYAPQSKDKNLDYRKGIEGDYKLIEEDLKFICDQFIGAIKENRSGKLNLEFDNPFTGKMYKAEDAISVGLIDGIATLQELVNKISNKSASKEDVHNKSLTYQKTSTMFDKFSKLNALKGKKAEEVTEEMIEAANAELVVKGITTVQLIESAEISEVETQLSTLQKQNTELSQKVKSLEDKITSLEAEDGADPVNAKKEKDAITEDPAKAAEEKMAGFAHNKAAAEFLGN